MELLDAELPEVIRREFSGKPMSPAEHQAFRRQLAKTAESTSR